MNGGRDKISAFEVLQRAVLETKTKLTSAQLKAIIDQLVNFKKDVEQKEQNGNMDLLLHFLQHSRDDKLAQLENIRKELEYLDNDINHIEGNCVRHSSRGGHSPSPEPHSDITRALMKRTATSVAHTAAADGTVDGPQDAHAEHSRPQPVQHPLVPPLLPLSNSIGIDEDYPPTKRPRVKSQFEDLQHAYLRMRTSRLGTSSSMHDVSGACSSGEGGTGDGTNDAKAPEEAPLRTTQHQENAITTTTTVNTATNGLPLVHTDTDALQDSGAAAIDNTLQEFSRMLTALSHCSQLSLLAEIPRPSLRQSSSIISSIDYSRDGSLFATAGVSKRISVFEHATVVKDQTTMIHCPIMELVTRSKLSCISWNKYLASHLASSDYEGVVTLWDINAASMVQEYEAHRKRIWTIDYCAADPTLLASGSDDCVVKLWSTRSPSSINQIAVKANVCTVKWKPGSSHELAVGSADHTVSLYDFRQVSRPLAVFQGHKKAVSFVRWCNEGELVSASTDSTLRLWGIGEHDPAGTGSVCGKAERVYQGHVNEKNFVGLSVEGDVIACGSESHEVFVYHKHLSRPVARFSFGNNAVPDEASMGGAAAASGGPDGTANEAKAFVSALCWRPQGEELLVANSLGTVRMLKLSGSVPSE